MVKENNSRSFLLDFLKGIAINAVILYHSGLFTYGYLGVEIFLVVGGYLTTKASLHFPSMQGRGDDVSYS
jgi:peptidoglycan/LPS O-acetylase OafA/YrhL